MRDAYAKLRASYAIDRRDYLTSQGLCINGAGHGAPMQGHRRCRWCVAVHKLGHSAAIARAARDERSPQPPRSRRIDDSVAMVVDGLDAGRARGERDRVVVDRRDGNRAR